MESKVIKTKGIGWQPIIFGLVVCCISGLFASGLISLRGRGGDEAAMIVGSAFMVIGLLPILWGLRLLLIRPKGLYLTQTGFSDRQLFRNEIPWTALSAVRSGKAVDGRNAAVWLDVPPEALASARATGAGRLLSIRKGQGVSYTTKMIDIPLKDFADTVHAYANAALRQGR
ncbi:hypothetical protein [Pseudooceanicola algae]|uniref:PH domain-containing protein n=1 Tax=Pseudooceanicola algae TaxID=1537215 RepID=A0A418SJR2_9RHOB|nr:hypothetical protein [Pseudooceanicola algae]QPM90668.1 hypothetical protein PSAL_019070 [Pseudooceanicola algae]